MSTDITTSQLPTHLQEAVENKQSTGLEDMIDYIVPPRLKVVQDKREDESLAGVPSGEVFITPQLERICGAGENFYFTPIFTWDEFCVHSQYQDKDSEFILERTNDPKSELAEKCRNRISEPYNDGKYKKKFVTHLNFLVGIHGLDVLEGIEVLLSFYIGEFKTGQALLNQLRMRTNGGIPMYGHIFEASTSKHTGGGNDWQGLDIRPPCAEYRDAGGSQFVEDGELYEYFEARHNLMKENKAKLQPNYGETGTASDVEGNSDTNTL